MVRLLNTTLQDAGYSLTQPRQKTFKALLNKQPQSMHEIIRSVPDVDRASVYRSIELFEKLGIVHRLPIGFKYKLELSDLFLEHHHHMVCRNCGKTEDMPVSQPLEQLIVATARAYGYHDPVHILEVQGLCDECWQKISTRTNG